MQPIYKYLHKIPYYITLLKPRKKLQFKTVYTFLGLYTTPVEKIIIFVYLQFSFLLNPFRELGTHYMMLYFQIFLTNTILAIINCGYMIDLYNKDYYGMFS